jgi:hypothetical protein
MKIIFVMLTVLVIMFAAPPAGAIFQDFDKSTIDGDFESATEALVVDLDGDGDLDIAAVALKDGVAWYENDGTGGYTGHVVDGSIVGAQSVAVADFDKNGHPDIVIASYDDYISWYESTPSSAPPPADPFVWNRHDISTTFQTAISVAVADFDDDGDPDILGAARDGNDVAWWQNNLGETIPWTMFYIDSNWDGPGDVEAGDLDGDGRMDAVAMSLDTNTIVWWRNQAASSGVRIPEDPVEWTPHTICSTFTGANDIVLADLDKDRDLDVVGVAFNQDADPNYGEAAWWESRSSGNPAPNDPRTWTRYRIDSNEMRAGSAVNVADLDRDGDKDVICGDGSYSNIWWADNNGSQNFNMRKVSSDSGRSVDSGDLDDDGDVDIVSTYQSAWDLNLYRNTQILGNSSFETGPKLPAMWKGRNLTGGKDRRVTNGKWGEASFKMAGNGSSKHIKQSTDVLHNDGGTVYVSAWSKAKGVPPGGGPYKVQVKVLHNNGSVTKKSLNFKAGTHKWQYRKARLDLAKGYKKVTVFVRYGRTSGKVWFDNVQVVHEYFQN